MGWDEDTQTMDRISIYAQLGLPAGFDLDSFIDEYLNEFPDYKQP